jgi:hypothetical protein
MKNKLYKFKRVLQTVLTVKSNFTNWDDILKRQLKGMDLVTMDIFAFKK